MKGPQKMQRWSLERRQGVGLEGSATCLMPGDASQTSVKSMRIA
jgi:hypothetical protein